MIRILERSLHKNLSAVEAKTLLTFLMNEVSYRIQNQCKSAMNDRIFALFIQTSGVIVSLFGYDVDNKVRKKLISHEILCAVQNISLLTKVFNISILTQIVLAD